VRPIGGIPTAFVDSIEKVRSLRQDHDRDCCDIEFHDGRRISASFHLFTARELRSYLERHFQIEVLRGLDLFHSRFAADTRWNPPVLGDEDRLAIEIDALEERYAANPAFLERAAHLLFVGRRRPSPRAAFRRRASGSSPVWGLTTAHRTEQAARRTGRLRDRTCLDFRCSTDSRNIRE
jgi:hypothetical protein